MSVEELTAYLASNGPVTYPGGAEGPGVTPSNASTASTIGKALAENKGLIGVGASIVGGLIGNKSAKTAAEQAVEQLAQVGAKPTAEALVDDSKPTTRDEAKAAYEAAVGAKAKAAVWKQYKALLS